MEGSTAAVWHAATASQPALALPDAAAAAEQQTTTALNKQGGVLPVTNKQTPAGFLWYY